MKWLPLERDSLEKLKKLESVLMFRDSNEYPYDIVQYGEADQEAGIEEEYWHSYLHINVNQYEYSTEELLEDFTHYFPLKRAVK